MSEEFASQFGAGSGGELGKPATASTPRKPGKMESLRSSSALAFNVFAPWHGRDLAPLARALDVEVVHRTVEFEKKFRHGLSSAPPNLDVVLDGSSDRPLGIESKFTEPYGPKEPDPPLDVKYRAEGIARWANLGLHRCQQLAALTGSSVQFKRLGVAQLLKHVLGLAHSTGRRPRLLCVWFDSGCEEAREHRDELALFSEFIGDEVDFSHRTYQQVFDALSPAIDPIPGYSSYLRSRYAAA